MSARLGSAAAWAAVVSLTAGLYLLSACGGASEPAASPAATPAVSPAVSPAVPEGRPELLSEWGQLEQVDGALVTAPGVVAYSLNSALFSDYAHKLRTVSVPSGSAPAVYDDQHVFDFPVGTVITKTFYFPLPDAAPPSETTDAVAKVAQLDDAPAAPLELADVRLLETRVLVHRADGWDALPYVWDADQSEATLARVGDLIPLTLVDQTGTAPDQDFPYVVPNVNQCASCHAVDHTSGVVQPIGPAARHLNRTIEVAGETVSQLDHWAERGVLDLLGRTPASAPAATAWDDESAPVDDRARAYLDINCAHCHNAVGPADTSGLFLEASTAVGASLGICKLPIAAGTGTGGRPVGIVPGEPDQSIFVFRMQTTDPGAMMPELGRSLAHTEGLDLISDWISALDGTC